MRPVMLALAGCLIAAPAFAQAPPTAPRPAETRSPGAPVDLGPRTPDADAAHRGGGVVLEGAPGAPAPAPQPTPPIPGASRQGG